MKYKPGKHPKSLRWNQGPRPKKSKPLTKKALARAREYEAQERDRARQESLQNDTRSRWDDTY